MKIRLILIGMVASLGVPFAGADAREAFDPGLNQVTSGDNLERGTAPTAENFGRKEDDDKGDKGRKCDDGDKGDKGDKDGDCEKSPDKPRH
jgi:hypothetical protein